MNLNPRGGSFNIITQQVLELLNMGNFNLITHCGHTKFTSERKREVIQWTWL
jgi:hypothetical protein